MLPIVKEDLQASIPSVREEGNFSARAVCSSMVLISPQKYLFPKGSVLCCGSLYSAAHHTLLR